MKPLLTGIFVSLSLPALHVVAAEAARAAVIRNPSPGYPPALGNEQINDGHALVACIFDDDGSVLDVWTLESSHEAFAKVSEEALRQWRFANAATNAPAVPWPRSDVVRFDFRRSGQITTWTQLEAMKAAVPSQPPPTGRLEKLPTLSADRLKRIAGSEPSLPAGQPGGEVILEFLVDRSGAVRVPTVIRAANPAKARASVVAILKWRFGPLPRDFAAPAVRQRWRFNFPSTLKL